MNDDFFMQMALKEARKSNFFGEVPVGAVITLDEKIIASGHNLSISRKDPTMHAEISAIRKASESMGNYRLTGTSIYVTLEPCAMCYGAIVHARISRLIFGAHDPKTGVCGSKIKLHEQDCFNHNPKIRGGVLEEDCSLVLKNFFKKKRG